MEMTGEEIEERKKRRKKSHETNFLQGTTPKELSHKLPKSEMEFPIGVTDLIQVTCMLFLTFPIELFLVDFR